MAYITESQLAGTLDLPIALPTTLVQQGDWLVIGSVQLAAPMQLSYRFLNLSLLSSTVPVANITGLNQIYGNLGLVYVVLRLNYVSGSPGAAAGFDTVIATNLGTVQRDINGTLMLTTPGVYSWLIANNCQASNDPASLISSSTSIDFTVGVTGQVRLELSP